MTVAELIQALALPESTRVNQRVPKKLLAEHGATTARDRRQIQDAVAEITWLASLKPHLVGVPAFQDAHRHYLELAVLSLALKPGAEVHRLVELVHRSIPYPVLLVTACGTCLALSMAHLRAAQTEADKTVLDGELLSVELPADGPGAPFLAALPLACQPRGDLYTLYQGWMDTVDALDIARETGRFQPSPSRAQAAARHAALQQCRQLRLRLAHLRTQAAKERQIARQVALNQELRTLQDRLQTLRQRLTVGRLAAVAIGSADAARHLNES